MRIGENQSYLAEVNFRSSGGALLRNAGKPLAQTDSVSSSSANSAAAREVRVAELRRQYQEGTYKVDAREVSSKIVERHLKA